MPPLLLTPLCALPRVQPGDDLAALIASALTAVGESLRPADALIVTSKIISKSEGRIVDLRTITPGAHALTVAERVGKDPRLVELVLRESTDISRMAPNILVTRHRLGFTSANAGIDQSNLGTDEDHVLLLPLDPDESALRLRERLALLTGIAPGIVISDSHGRPFRMGNVGIAIGVAGLPALVDLRGQPDLFGRTLRISIQGYADMVAAAGVLVMGEGAEGCPVVLARGLPLTPAPEGRARDLNRPPEQDLYRDTP